MESGTYPANIYGNFSIYFTATGSTTINIQSARDTGSSSYGFYCDANAPIQLVIEDVGLA